MTYQTDRNTSDLVTLDLSTVADASVALLDAIAAADPAIVDAGVVAAVTAMKTALVNTTSYVAV